MSLLNMTRLEVLDIHGNNLGGNIPTDIPQNAALKFLSVSDNKFEGPIPTELTNLNGLFHLDLSGNALSEQIPGQIGEMTNLQFLFMHDNAFSSGTIPMNWKKLTNLKELSLKGTSRSKSINTFIGDHLSDLVLLDLSDNQFTGTIPVNFGQLTELEYLIMNKNPGINGRIPSSIEALSSLRVAFFDNMGLKGDALWPVCTLPSFGGSYKPPGGSIATADCDGDDVTPSKVTCDCCKVCCKGGDTECNQHDATLSRLWDKIYSRYEFD
jgi:hypothetical protein